MRRIMRLAVTGTILALAGCASTPEGGGGGAATAEALDTSIIPSVGNCRYWDPAKDPANQQAEFPCATEHAVPPNTFLLHRVSKDKVTQVIFLKSGAVGERRTYDASSGRYLGK